MNKVAVISGATGLIGTELLRQLLQDDYYEKIIAVVRRPLDINNEKLVQKIIDFEELSSSLKEIRADHAYCCLGTTIRTAGSKERQFRIDHDYVVMFAQACHDAGVKRFAVVSSTGSDKNSSNFYLRTKGLMEQEIKKIEFEGLFILRPSFLLGKRKEFRAGERVGKAVLFIFQPLMVGKLRKYRGIKDSVVASGMTKLVKGDFPGVSIIESDKI